MSDQMGSGPDMTESGDQTELTKQQSEPAETAQSSERVSTKQILTTLIGIIGLVTLSGLAGYSWISDELLQPITGLATVGGICGGIGIIVMSHIMFGGPESLREWLDRHTQGAIYLVTGSGIIGFVYPQIMWELGMAMNRDGFFFGSLSVLTTSLPSVGAYVGAVYLFTVILLWVSGLLGILPPARLKDLVWLFPSFVVYGLCLVLATGFATDIWYEFIPVAVAVGARVLLDLTGIL